MCLATPMELKRINGEWGYVEHEGHEYKVSLSLIPEPKTGDWILAHGELGINKIPASEAKTILKLIQESCSCHTHNHTHSHSHSHQH
jgi:hydrogenase assembly chaperone HypC/HupF